MHGCVAALGISGLTAESEQLGGDLTIDWESGAGDRARAERISVRPLVRALESRGIALELLDDCEKVVSNRRRLCALRVRVNGDDRFAMAIDEIEERSPQLE